MGDQLDQNHCLLDGLGLGDWRDDGVVALLAIRKADGRANLGVGEVLEALEVLLGVSHVAGALHGAGHGELARGVVGIDIDSLLEDGDGLVVLLELGVADAFEIIGIGVARIELNSPLETLQGLVRLVACVLGEAEVVPGLRALGIEGDRGLQRLFGVVELLQGKQRDAFIDGGLRQFWVLLHRIGKGGGGTLGELLAHLRNAAVVHADRLRVETKLRSGGAGLRRSDGSRGKTHQGNRPQTVHRFLSHFPAGCFSILGCGTPVSRARRPTS